VPACPASTGSPDEPHDRAVQVDGQRVGQLRHDPDVERLGAQLEDAPPVGPIRAVGALHDRFIGATRHRRDHRDLVAVGEPRRRLGIVAVPREAERRAPGREDRVAAGERDPGRLDVGVVGQLERDGAGPRELPLDRKEADTDGDRHGRGQPPHDAIRSPSPTGRIVALKRGSPRTEASKDRSASVLRSLASAGRAPDARPLHRTLSAAMSAPGASRLSNASRYCAVLGLERVDEHEVERSCERGVVVGERLERLAVDHGDPLIGDAGVAPPGASAVGPRVVRVDRHDRAVAGSRAPSRGSRTRRRSRPPRPVSAGDQHLEHAPGVTADDRDALGLGLALDGGERGGRGAASDSIHSRSVASGIQV
jgi:hypothetical protein